MGCDETNAILDYRMAKALGWRWYVYPKPEPSPPRAMFLPPGSLVDGLVHIDEGSIAGRQRGYARVPDFCADRNWLPDIMKVLVESGHANRQAEAIPGAFGDVIGLALGIRKDAWGYHQLSDKDLIHVLQLPMRTVVEAVLTALGSLSSPVYGRDQGFTGDIAPKEMEQQ